MKAMVLEDDLLTRISVVVALQRYGYQIVVNESTASQALLRAKSTQPDVAVLDLHLGAGATGLDVAQVLRKMNPQIGIVLLTAVDDPRLLSPALPEVPSGIIYLKKQSMSDLGPLKSALSQCRDFHAGSTRIPFNSTIGSLTEVQVDTLRLVAQGLSNSEIAVRRSVNEKSIEKAIARVAKALRIHPDSKSNQRVHLARVFFRAIGARGDV
jgi:DNA-binding NarL/FixJ family response regulator